MSDPKFTRQTYYVAAQEKLVAAESLLTHGQYFVAHYVSGIAIESMLRGLSANDVFDSGHSIEYWSRRSGLTSGGSQERRDEFVRYLDEANLRWRANQRYMTAKMLDTHLESIKLDRVRGDHVKYSSRRMFDLANFIVGAGVVKWQLKNKSNKS